VSYTINFAQQAEQDLIFHKKSGNKAVLKKIVTLLKEIAQQPFTGTGKPESLKHDLSGKWSRRINQEHRLVYEVLENKILIHSLKGHY
jgi:toxin YoeB